MEARMSKTLLYLYIPFVLYSLISFVFKLNAPLDLYAMIFFRGDILVSIVFSMLGVFPLLYLVILLSYQKQKLYVYVLFALGFMLGGFVLLPALMTLNQVPKKETRHLKLLTIILPIILIIMLLIGILLGSLDVYINEFLTNRFVNIMTIDLIVLILTPYVLGEKGFPFINYTKLVD
jgi:hypothetical protein